jgi:hypothetical protein
MYVCVLVCAERRRKREGWVGGWWGGGGRVRAVMKCHEFMEYVCMFVFWCLRREKGVGVGGCGVGERQS